jgi:hypothetical protein
MAVFKQGYFGWAGGGKNGAIVNGYAATRFSTFPQLNDPPPDTNPPDGGPVTTDNSFGGPGAFLVPLQVVQDYWFSFDYGGIRTWAFVAAESLSGQNPDRLVLTCQGPLSLPQTTRTTVSFDVVDVMGSDLALQGDSQTIQVNSPGIFVVSYVIGMAIANGSTRMLLDPLAGEGVNKAPSLYIDPTSAIAEIVTQQIVVLAPYTDVIQLEPIGGSGNESLTAGAMGVTIARVQ